MGRILLQGQLGAHSAMSQRDPLFKETFKTTTIEPCHEIMVLSVLRKLVLQTCMHSYPVGLDV